MPLPSGRRTIEQVEIGPAPAALRWNVAAESQIVTRYPSRFQDQAQRQADVRLVIENHDMAFADRQRQLRLVGQQRRHAASPGTPRHRARRPPSAMSPFERMAFFFAMDSPSPMPCFLNVMVGSNRVADASAADPRSGIVHFNRDLRRRPSS